MGLFIRTLAKAFLGSSGGDQTVNEGVTIALSNIWAYISRTVDLMSQIFGALVWSGHQEYGAWRGSVGRGAGVGSDVQAIVNAQQQQWHHLLTKILPASLAWVEGDIAAHHLGDLSKRIAELEREVKDLYKWRARMTNWQGKIVNPAIKSYDTFWSYFNGKPKSTLDVWVRWFQHQDEYAVWATPILAHTFLQYLGRAENKVLRDTLAGMMVDAWSDDADAVWASLERWLTTDT